MSWGPDETVTHAVRDSGSVAGHRYGAGCGTRRAAPDPSRRPARPPQRGDGQRRTRRLAVAPPAAAVGAYDIARLHLRRAPGTGTAATAAAAVHPPVHTPHRVPVEGRRRRAGHAVLRTVGGVRQAGAG